LELKSFTIGVDEHDRPMLELEIKPDVVPMGTHVEFKGRIGIAFSFLRGLGPDRDGPTVFVIDTHKTQGMKNVEDIAKNCPDAIIGAISLMEYAKTREARRNVILWLELVAAMQELIVNVTYLPVEFETGIPSHPRAVTAPVSYSEAKHIPRSEAEKIRKIASLSKSMLL